MTKGRCIHTYCFNECAGLVCPEHRTWRRRLGITRKLVLALVVELKKPQSLEWMAQARCVRAQDPEVFFPGTGDKGGSVKFALQFCHDCPVKLDCAAFGLYNHDAYGILGGFSPSQRMSIGRAISRLTPDKLCTGCGELKSKDHFRASSVTFDRKHSRCIGCPQPRMVA